MLGEPQVKRSLAERIWCSGVLQAGVYDVALLMGLAVIGHAIWRWSPVAAELYGGVLLAGLSLLLALERRRPQKRGD